MFILYKMYEKYTGENRIRYLHSPFDCRLCKGAFPNCAGVGANLNSWFRGSFCSISEFGGNISDRDVGVAGTVGDLISLSVFMSFSAWKTTPVGNI